ncbi:hypothetical protein [Bacteroides xylanisolvens]|uniref:hypothetical protein n=1 Tax=Bacteroides xylanisolvens TaxID=371601 RepID=UPI001C37D06E|nr:hypothetical protein [Bacteroides xylanisolvens]MBV3619422.1 hypothetical protein [Bacteroides xylanisolvens]
MPVPATIDVCQKYLFADLDEMSADGLPEVIQQRLLRLRDMYNFWLQFPRKKDLEIVAELELRYKVSKSTAYEDIRIIKRLLGDLAKTTKDYHRYKFCQMIDETYEMAKRIKDARAMGAAANYYGKYTQLDKEDILDKGYDKIVVQPFEPTDDPSVLGIKAIPNIREKIKSKIQQYWSEDIEDVEFEEVEFNEDEIFNTKLKKDETIL